MEDSGRKIHQKKCGFCGKVNTWEHGRKHERCSHCDSIEWDKPKDECILFNLQEDYLKTRDQKVLGQMYLVMYEYAQRIILKQLPYKYDKDKLEDKTEDAVTTIIRYYLTKPNYKILYSFGAMLYGPIKQELYKKKQQDIDRHEFSYDSMMSEDSDKPFKDFVSADLVNGEDKYTKELVNIANKSFLVSELSEFTAKVYETICKNRGVKDAILALTLLHHFLQKKKESFFDKFYEQYGAYLQEIVEGEKLILLEYLQTLAKDS